MGPESWDVTGAARWSITGWNHGSLFTWAPSVKRLAPVEPTWSARQVLFIISSIAHDQCSSPLRPPPATVAAATAAIRVVRSEPQRLARLWENQRYFLGGLRKLKFQLTPTVSPIIPVVIGNAQTAEAFARRLLQLGVYAPAIRPPTVPKDTCRIRTTVTSEHTRTQLDLVLAAFATAGEELGLLA